MRYFAAALLAVAFAVTAHAPAHSQDDSERNLYPRYASLKRTEVNVRSGPGNQYPILWIYQRVGYPVQILAKFDNYYKIRDIEGEEGWAFSGMVSAARTSVVTGTEAATLYRRNDPTSDIVARLSPGVIVELGECPEEHRMCKIETAGLKGWMNASNLVWIDKL